jgi:short-subunit dehydrogenase
MLTGMRPLALVTGASAGIGAAFARQLAARGYDLALVARRPEPLEALAAELRRTPGLRAEVLPADLSTDAGRGAIERWIAAADSLDLLVNNAGFGTKGRFFEADLAGQDTMHRLHVLAPMRLTHVALQGMVARRRGAVINVSSVAGFFASPGNVSYCATKHWMNVFTEGLAAELAGAGSPVKVQTLCPGFTYTEFHDRMGYDRRLVARWLWLRADDVVDQSLRGLDRGKLYVITGWPYRLAVLAARFLPASLARAGNRRFRRPD